MRLPPIPPSNTPGRERANGRCLPVSATAHPGIMWSIGFVVGYIVGAVERLIAGRRK